MENLGTQLCQSANRIQHQYLTGHIIEDFLRSLLLPRIFEIAEIQQTLLILYKSYIIHLHIYAIFIIFSQLEGVVCLSIISWVLIRLILPRLALYSFIHSFISRRSFSKCTISSNAHCLPPCSHQVSSEFLNCYKFLESKALHNSTTPHALTYKHWCAMEVARCVCQQHLPIHIHTPPPLNPW